MQDFIKENELEMNCTGKFYFSYNASGDLSSYNFKKNITI